MAYHLILLRRYSLLYSLAIGMVKTDLITVQIIKTQLMQTYLNMQYSLKSQLLIVKSFTS